MTLRNAARNASSTAACRVSAAEAYERQIIGLPAIFAGNLTDFLSKRLLNSLVFMFIRVIHITILSKSRASYKSAFAY